jgi:hypothetical protein
MSVRQVRSPDRGEGQLAKQVKPVGGRNHNPAMSKARQKE